MKRPLSPGKNTAPVQQRSILRSPVALTKDSAVYEEIGEREKRTEQGLKNPENKDKKEKENATKWDKKPQQGSRSFSAAFYSHSRPAFFFLPLSQSALISLTLCPVSSLLLTSLCGIFHLPPQIPSQHRPGEGRGSRRRDGRREERK